MKILELLRNPLIKGIGICLVLYFALFANKQHPKSLGNRLSPENVKKDLEDATSKGSFIISNVKMANELAKNPDLQNKLKETAPVTPPADISIEDLDLGAGDKTVACGDEVAFAYGVYGKDGRQLDFVSSQKFIIGSQANVLLEKNITGMKAGGIRYINIPRGTQIADPKIARLLIRSDSDLRVQVTLLSFATTASQNLSCN